MSRQVKQKGKTIKTTEHQAPIDEALDPPQEPNNHKTNMHYARIEETGLFGTDQTEKLPYISKRGYKYIFVLYSYDPNSILVRPMKNKTDTEFLRVHSEVIDYLQSRGFKPTIQRLDNEASKAYTDNITKHNMKFQFTPAQMHRRNIAERAI